MAEALDILEEELDDVSFTPTNLFPLWRHFDRPIKIEDDENVQDVVVVVIIVVDSFHAVAAAATSVVGLVPFRPLDDVLGRRRLPFRPKAASPSIGEGRRRQKFLRRRFPVIILQQDVIDAHHLYMADESGYGNGRWVFFS